MTKIKDSLLTTEDLLEMAFYTQTTIDHLKIAKKVDVQQRQAIERLEGKLNNLFGGVFDGVLEEFEDLNNMPSTASQRNQLLQIFEEIEDDYNDIMIEEAIQNAQLGKTGTISELHRLGVFLDIGPDEYSLSDHAYDLLRQHVFEASEHTLNRMKSDVMETITESYDEGLGIDDTVEEIRDHFEMMEDYELERIARTEVVGHQNEGRFLTEEELGVEYHQWWTAEDERVRGLDPNDVADHVIMHGEIVRVGDEFSNGLLHPGDHGGPIEEWINCRCRSVPFIIPDDKMAPPNLDQFKEEDLIDRGA